MSILVSLHHATRYQYDRPVGLGPQVIRLRPGAALPHAGPSYSLKVTPAEHFVNWQQDPHGNWLARFVFPEKTTRVLRHGRSPGRHEVINPFDFFVEPYAEKFPFAYPAELRQELAPYLEPSRRAAARRHCSPTIPRGAANTIDFLVELNQRSAARSAM